MEKKIKSWIGAGILMLLFANVSQAQSNNIQQSGISNYESESKTGQQDSLMPETINIIEDSASNSTESAFSKYRETEKIHIYSGSQDGNNIIRTVEIPLPQDNSNEDAYIPH